MPAQEIDDYLSQFDDTARSSLEALRRTILEIVPAAEQGLAYGTPVFKIDGRAVAGFAAFKNHLSYLPHSGSVLSQLPDEVARYTTTKGSLHFAIGSTLPKALVRKLIAVRRREIANRAAS